MEFRLVCAGSHHHSPHTHTHRSTRLYLCPSHSKLCIPKKKILHDCIYPFNVYTVSTRVYIHIHTTQCIHIFLMFARFVKKKIHWINSAPVFMIKVDNVMGSWTRNHFNIDKWFVCVFTLIFFFWHHTISHILYYIHS